MEYLYIDDGYYDIQEEYDRSINVNTLDKNKNIPEYSDRVLILPLSPDGNDDLPY